MARQDNNKVNDSAGIDNIEKKKKENERYRYRECDMYEWEQ